MKVILNKRGEMMSIGPIIGLQICMDYWKLNDSLEKDHFPIPSIDQMPDCSVGERMVSFS